MSRKYLLPLIGIATLFACSPPFPDTPTDVKAVEKKFGVEICYGSQIELADNLGTVATAPVYEIEFPSADCADDFLQKLMAGSTYEHPFGDEGKLLGSSPAREIQFMTVRTGRRAITFFVSDISWLSKAAKNSEQER